ncbi:RnfABCDGE type electron transport complex subunit D [Clostridiales Family XIII bacterium BX16]|uniref:Ion-translocating oxidoreductase complex subunit D n=1 Tax=Lentihominibacter faecis TaxID=2764712 RepID=A0A923SRF3_9FIRM|nr:RnfABCDGE type electron transport complex subunit D [Lentihominibacter faecis]MBC5999350.1 RnfABCDGE type electron transport complex subunit D [Lentihominibacter faecis]
MDNKYHEKLIVSSSPHMVTKTDTSKIMGTVLIALLPAFAVGIYQFGFRVVTLTAVFVASCVLFEYLYNKIAKKPQTVGDLSAVLTGVLLAFNCPSSLPYEIAIVGSFAAIVVIKQLFGGIGQNLVNPAVTARVFMFIAFATPMTSWPTPRGGHATGAVVDATTSATPLGVLSHGSFADVYNDGFTKMDLFLGNVGGCIGEVSALAILIGGLFLIWKKVISPIIPVTFIATVFVLGLIWGGFDGALFHILAGGLMLGAFFCATDYVTSPTLPLGKVIFGIGCGLFTMLIRIFASYPEGVSFAILLMNILTPYIDKICEKRMYKLPKKAKEGEK